jgi:hypothetical protein
MGSGRFVTHPPQELPVHGVDIQARRRRPPLGLGLEDLAVARRHEVDELDLTTNLHPMDSSQAANASTTRSSSPRTAAHYRGFRGLRAEPATTK